MLPVGWMHGCCPFVNWLHRAMCRFSFLSTPWGGRTSSLPQHTSTTAGSSSTQPLWKECFTNPSQWFHSKVQTQPSAPDLKLKHTKESLWVEGWYSPSWVEGRLQKMETPNKAMHSPIAQLPELNLGEALALLEQMPHLPSVENLTCILHRCRRHKSPAYAMCLYAYLCKSRLEAHKSLGNYLVPMLVEVGCLCDAQHVFDRLVDRNEYSWNSLITGYIECGDLQHAFVLHQKMQEDSVLPSGYWFVALLKACARLKDTEKGQEIHAAIVRKGLLEINPFVGSTLVDMYAKCGLLAKAQQVFDKLPVRDAVSWNALITGYAEHNLDQDALNCFEQMQLEGVSPNAVTFVCSLKACGSVGAIDKGIEIHAEIARKGLLEGNIFVGNTLVDMYAKFGFLAKAQDIFSKLPVQNAVSWNALIAGYAEHDLGQDALNCFEQMQLEGVSPDAVTFVCSLKACGRIAALDKGQEIHAEIARKGLLERHPFVGNTLVDMYAKCGLLAKAQGVLHKLPVRTAVSWNALITGFAEHDLGQDALNCFEQMQLEGVSPDAVTFVCSLKACGSIGAIDKGQEIHAEIVRKGLLKRHPFVGNTLVDMYAKCGLLAKAQEVLDRLPVRNTVSWNALIAGFTEHDLGHGALNCFEQMQLEGVSPDAVTFICSLKACGRIEAIDKGQEIHAEIARKGLLDSDPFVGSTLVDMYAKCGMLSRAQEVFDKLPVRDVVSWNALITGYAKLGEIENVFVMLDRMRAEDIKPDGVTFLSILTVCSHTGYIECEEFQHAFELHQKMQEDSVHASTYMFVSLLKACARLKDTERGQEIHAEIGRKGLLERCPFVGSTLVDMYTKCGLLAKAQEVFDKLPVRDAVSWNALIAGYVEHELGQDALDCFEQMQLEGIPPNEGTFVCSLKACGSIGAIDKVQEIHAEIVRKGLLEKNHFVGSTLVDMYAKSGLLAKAQEVFEELRVRDSVSWTALISGYVEHDLGQDALNCFEQMQLEGVSSDVVTFVCSLKACGSIGAIDKGREIHAEIVRKALLERNPFVGTTLVDMYAKCGLLAKAQEVFDKLSVRDAVSWNAIIAGYAEHDLGQDALNYFEQMQLEGVSSDAVTFVCSLKACGGIGAIDKGQEIHAEIARKGLLERDPVVGNTLVDMYAKCGLLAKAQEVFDKLPVRDAFSWSALIAGYAQLGESENVFLMLDRMRVEDITPDAVTFLSILTVCSHTGLVEKGQTYFDAMCRDYGIAPTIEHHNCMVDLLGRAGQLDKAVQLIKKMPFNPNFVLWHTMLGACRKWGNVELGKWAFEHAVDLDKKDAAAYVLMSNIYSDAHMQEDSVMSHVIP